MHANCDVRAKKKKEKVVAQTRRSVGDRDGRLRVSSQTAHTDVIACAYSLCV